MFSSPNVYSPTFPQKISYSSLSTLLSLSTIIGGSHWAINHKNKKRKRDDSQDTLFDPNELQDFVTDLKFQFGAAPADVEMQEQNFFPQRMSSAGTAPRQASLYYRYGSPLNNMATGPIISTTSWGDHYTTSTGKQGWRVLATMGHTDQVGVDNSNAATFETKWPRAYLNIAPNSTTTPSNNWNAVIPKTNAIGLETVYHTFMLKNLHSIALFCELYLIGCTESTKQDPIQDMNDACTMYWPNTTQTAWAPPLAGQVVTGRQYGYPNVEAPGFRPTDAEDFARKFKIFRKHKFTLGHGECVSLDYKIDFNRVYTRGEWDELNDAALKSNSNKTLYFVLRFHSEPVVDATPDTAGNNITIGDVSLGVTVTQKKIFRVPRDYSKYRANASVSGLSANVIDANEKTMNTNDQVASVQDAIL